MSREELKQTLLNKPGYLKKSSRYLASKYNTSEQIVSEVLKEAKTYNKIKVNWKPTRRIEGTINPDTTTKWVNEYWEDKKQITLQDLLTVALNSGQLTLSEVLKLSQSESVELFKSLLNKKQTKVSLPKPYLNGDLENVLVIGDLHSPFILRGYLEFCREQQEKYKCGTVIFIGDIVESNSWSYHEHDVDGMGQAEEISKAKEQLSDWFKVFPIAKCTLGNHDLLIKRKMKTAGLSVNFMKSFNEIWNAPDTWEFAYEFIINGVRYTHGHKGNAIKVARSSRISTAQGHLHTEAFVEYSVSDKDKIFGLQVGCGIDHKAYAFEYSKPFPNKPVIGCGAVLESGTLPFNILMKL